MKSSKVVNLNDRLMSWDEFVGEIRDLLKAHKGHMTTLASENGLSYRWLVDFKRGVWREVTADMVIRLAQGLGMTFKVLVEGSPLTHKPSRAATARVASRA